MRRRPVLKVAVGLAACTLSWTGAPAAEKTHTVKAGESIVWINKDPFPHNVSSKAGDFRSGNLAPDGKWRFLPRNRGTFEYVCTLHPGMKARLHVK